MVIVTVQQILHAIIAQPCWIKSSQIQFYPIIAFLYPNNRIPGPYFSTIPTIIRFCPGSIHLRFFELIHQQNILEMGPYLSEPIKQKKTLLGKGADYTFCVSEMQGWRKTMEDAAIHNSDLGDGNALFAVFDGHGGHQVSQYVESKFTDILVNLESYKKKKYDEALDLAFKLMDEKLLEPEVTKELNRKRSEDTTNPISKNTGCTANVLLITPTHFYVANAGDSRSVLCKDGKATELSFDHKPESEQQTKRIKNAGGVVYMGRVNGGLNLTRSFGDFDYKANDKLGYAQQMITCKPDIRTFERSNKDEFIIMGCDGIWEKYVQNSQGLVEILKKYIVEHVDDNKKILERLLDELLAKDTVEGLGCDNMTSILIRFK